MEASLELFKSVRLFLCDVDGVLTDMDVWVGGESEMKRFNIQDGLGLKLLQKKGIKIGWISNRPSYATTLRAVELKVDFLHQNDGNKVRVAEEILTRTGLKWSDICYMGDDVVDLGLIRRAGIGVAVANAIPEAKAVAGYVTQKSGGHGAVREVVELILKSQGKWQALIQHYSQ